MTYRKFDHDNIYKLDGFLRFLFEKNIPYTTHWMPVFSDSKKVVGVTGIVVY